MNGKEERVIIEPRKGRNDPHVHKTSLLVFSERELKMPCTSAEHCKENKKKLYYSNCYEVSFKNKTFTLVGPVIGAPAAVLIVKKSLTG